MRTIIKILSISIISVMLAGCFAEVDIEKKREVFSTEAAGELNIGMVGDMKILKDGTKFFKGVSIAVEEINEKGGTGGRLIKLLEKDDLGMFMNGITAAQEMSDNSEVTAVIGHPNSYVAIPAATIYDEAGVIMLSSIASNPKITRSGYRYIFQNIPNDNEIGKEMAVYMSEQGYKKVAVFYSDDDYGRGLANAFESTARSKNMSVMDRITGYSNDLDLEYILNSWKALEVDSIFIADSVDSVKDFIFKVKDMNFDVPIVGSDALDMNFIETLGDKAEGAVLATFYNPNDNSVKMKDFTAKFFEKYKEKPDVWAIQGYDSIKLLAYAIEQSGSASPSQIAKTIHSITSWESLTGNVHFDDMGRIQDKKVYKKIVRNGKFEYVE
jgi:branched-chain amino acid transport system substrate-binding protein